MVSPLRVKLCKGSDGEAFPKGQKPRHTVVGKLKSLYCGMARRVKKRTNAFQPDVAFLKVQQEQGCEHLLLKGGTITDVTNKVIR